MNVNSPCRAETTFGKEIKAFSKVRTTKPLFRYGFNGWSKFCNFFFNLIFEVLNCYALFGR